MFYSWKGSKEKKNCLRAYDYDIIIMKNNKNDANYVLNKGWGSV